MCQCLHSLVVRVRAQGRQSEALDPAWCSMFTGQDLHHWYFLRASSNSQLLCRCFCIFYVFMLSQMDTGWAFASFISKGLTLREFLLQAGMVLLGVWLIFRSVEESSFFHSQIPFHQSQRVTSLLPKPFFPSPYRVLGQTVDPLPHPWKCSVPAWVGF